MQLGGPFLDALGEGAAPVRVGRAHEEGGEHRGAQRHRRARGRRRRQPSHLGRDAVVRLRQVGQAAATRTRRSPAGPAVPLLLCARLAQPPSPAEVRHRLLAVVLRHRRPPGLGALAQHHQVRVVIDLIPHPRHSHLLSEGVQVAVAWQRVHQHRVRLLHDGPRLGAQGGPIVHELRKAARRKAAALGEAALRRAAAVPPRLRPGARGHVLDDIVATLLDEGPKVCERDLVGQREVVAVVQHQVHALGSEAEPVDVRLLARVAPAKVHARMAGEFARAALEAGPRLQVEPPQLRARKEVVPHLQRLASRNANLGHIEHLLADRREEHRVEVGVCDGTHASWWSIDAHGRWWWFCRLSGVWADERCVGG
eukprot:scaffold21819_cov65-Phaeocystis_antarctica.AAC.7